MISKIWIIFGVLFTTSLTGCVSTKNVAMDQVTFSSFRGKSIVLAKHEKPSFAAMTAGKAAFAMLGAAAMIAEGNKIVRENNIEDPALHIGNVLTNYLSEKSALQVIDHSIVTKKTDANGLAKDYPESDLILDVQTINWSFGYFPTNWSHYRVIYSAKLRLVNTKTTKIVAEGFCPRVPDESPNAPTQDALLKDNAALLKAELETAADYCISEFQKNVLKL